MAWGGLASRFTGLLIGKIRVLTGCEQRAPKAPCLGGLSIGQLKYGSLLHQSKQVRKARKRVWARQSPWSFVTYSPWHPITFVIPHLLEASYLLHPTLKGRGLQESVNSRRCNHWGPFRSCLLYSDPHVNGSLPILVCPGGPFPFPVWCGELGPCFPRSPYF